jgi:hypothetical protein
MCGAHKVLFNPSTPTPDLAIHERDNDDRNEAEGNEEQTKNRRSTYWTDRHSCSSRRTRYNGDLGHPLRRRREEKSTEGWMIAYFTDETHKIIRPAQDAWTEASKSLCGGHKESVDSHTSDSLFTTIKALRQGYDDTRVCQDSDTKPILVHRIGRVRPIDQSKR